mmetsp:Transcript_103295/g.236650  ORF Transcript_103295/g.236650 Transcript_103295/m.236650 type:complete len:826 (-) Transcript_103295:111-2588(-)
MRLARLQGAHRRGLLRRRPLCRLLSSSAESPAPNLAVELETLNEKITLRQSLRVAGLRSRLAPHVSSSVNEPVRYNPALARNLAPAIDPAILHRRLVESTELMSSPKETVLDEATCMGLLAAYEQHLHNNIQSAVVDMCIPSHGAEGGSPDPRLLVVGDTHGQLNDVLWILHELGPPSPSNCYVFNGDICDRGSRAVEIWLLVIAYQLKFPSSVTVLRGNHESKTMAERSARMGGGFRDECRMKYSEEVYQIFTRIFRLLPIFALIQNKIFVVHGGLPRVPGISIDDLRALPYRRDWQALPEKQLSRSRDDCVLFDALWADPHEGQGCIPSRGRGASCVKFGYDVTEDFCKQNNLQLCIRSHQVTIRDGRPLGHAFWHDNLLLTVFSASCYSGMLENPGAVAILRDNGRVMQGMPVSVQIVEHRAPRLSYMSSIMFNVNHPQAITKVRGAMNDERRGRSQVAEAKRLWRERASWLICASKDVLWTRLSEADTKNTGRVSIHEFQDICASVLDLPGIKWSRMARDHEYDGEVDYAAVLDDVSVYLAGGQLPTDVLKKLVHSTLAAGLNVGEAVALLDSSRVNKLTLSDVTTSLRELGIDLSEYQARSLWLKTCGTSSSVEPLEFFKGLNLQFTPEVATPSWSNRVMPELAKAILNTIATSDDSSSVTHTLRGVFEAADADGDGALCEAEFGTLVQAFAGSMQGPIDQHEISMLFKTMDVNGSGAVDVLEFLAAFTFNLSSDDELQKSVSEIVVSKMALNAHAIEFGCGLLDPERSGVVTFEDFRRVISELELGNAAKSIISFAEANGKDGVLRYTELLSPWLESTA